MNQAHGRSVNLSKESLEKLVSIINADGDKDYYRSGPQLVDFFNCLGESDEYGQGFPSRRDYTYDKLHCFNGTNRMEECIKQTFKPVRYADRIDKLDSMIDDFNLFLRFDKYKVVRNNETIVIQKIEELHIPDSDSSNDARQSYENDIINLISSADLGEKFKRITLSRIHEIENCISCGSSIAAIILIGSVLEGLLGETASSYPKVFNSARSAPKSKDDTVKPFNKWTFDELIVVAKELGILHQDTMQFSQELREFRNYVHIREMMKYDFYPDDDTIAVSYHILYVSVKQIADFLKETRQ